jgi:hypothetical protein
MASNRMLFDSRANSADVVWLGFPSGTGAVDARTYLPVGSDHTGRRRTTGVDQRTDAMKTGHCRFVLRSEPVVLVVMLFASKQLRRETTDMPLRI